MGDIDMEDLEEGEEEDMEEDDDDPEEVGPQLLGRMVKVTHLKSRADLIGKEGKVMEVYPDKDRVGVWFLHTKGLELSIPLASVDFLPTEPPKKCLNEIN
ncbi:unnamed protein product [Symbiodinium pilosum]|uniref:KOW domain-containing protein n=1 Tax=Symbiodinium pilosum TaxID=2952 RepID=A0A812L678_SYMPI|nr:unnamed protein product [Symbiodinium pilosum]